MSEVEEAISIVEYSRGTHVAWMEWIEAVESGRDGGCGDAGCRLTIEEHLKIAGDREYQRSRIERYDTVLRVLREHQTCPPCPTTNEGVRRHSG